MTAIEMLAERAALTGAMTENIPSPCVSVCRMDAHTGYCEGCLRSLDEIRLWSTQTDSDKQAVWARIAQRIAELSPVTP